MPALIGLVYALLILPLVTTATTLAAESGPTLRERLRALREGGETALTVARNIVYIQREGVDERRTSLDVYPVKAESPAPVLVYIHGGGWSNGDKSMVHQRPAWAQREGWVLVSVNYRHSPEVMHPEHARDVAAAVAWVHANIKDHGGDPARIALMGHSAGAHLAAIVSSDEQLLGEYGLEPGDLVGTVLLDGAGYNLPRRMKVLPPGRLGTMYHDAFGDDPARWEAASPTLQAKPGDDLPDLFCIHAGRRVEAKIEGEEIVKAWTASGARATLHHAPDKDHAGINHEMGVAGDPDTEAVQAFLRRVYAED